MSQRLEEYLRRLREAMGIPGELAQRAAIFQDAMRPRQQEIALAYQRYADQAQAGLLNHISGQYPVVQATEDLEAGQLVDASGRTVFVRFDDGYRSEQHIDIDGRDRNSNERWYLDRHEFVATPGQCLLPEDYVLRSSGLHIWIPNPKFRQLDKLLEQGKVKQETAEKVSVDDLDELFATIDELTGEE